MPERIGLSIALLARRRRRQLVGLTLGLDNARHPCGMVAPGRTSHQRTLAELIEIEL